MAYRGASARKEAAEDQVVQADEKSTDQPGEQDLAPLAEAEKASGHQRMQCIASGSGSRTPAV